jgi:hypothetical protein
VFTLGPPAPRQAGRWAEPDDGGQAGFQRFLAGAAAYRDAARGPWPLQASLRPPRSPQAHDAACVSGFLAELSAAMLASAPTEPR